MLVNKQKKGTGAQGDKGGGNMFLISVTVLGSAGPIRFIVKEEQLVATVIKTALRSYAREGRLPAMGSDQDHFLLYCSNYGSDALSSWEMIGTNGARNFQLCRKPKMDNTATNRRSIARKGNWKAWLKKSFNGKISSH